MHKVKYPKQCNNSWKLLKANEYVGNMGELVSSLRYDGIKPACEVSWKSDEKLRR